MKIIAYYRVSTKQQGESGLGLEGQVAAVAAYAAGQGAAIVRAYREVESGKRADRPELAKARRTPGGPGRPWSSPSWIGLRGMSTFSVVSWSRMWISSHMIIPMRTG